VQTLRRVPHTFFDAYFSGRYAQDVCNDGSIFVDRDGEHFGHVLEYMRDGVVSVVEPGAFPDVSLLRALKREFGFYCIELCAEQPVVLAQPEALFVMGGYCPPSLALSSMEQYDASTGQWSVSASMANGRKRFGACSVARVLYVIGGINEDISYLDSVEKYSPMSGTWSPVIPLPSARARHAAVAVGPAMYIIGGTIDGHATDTTLKYDSIQDTWSTIAPMPEPRHTFASCVYRSDIYIFGGYDEDEELSESQASIFKFDTNVCMWTTEAPMPFTCSDHSSSVLDGQVYIVGACVDFGQEVWRFDFATSIWYPLAVTSQSRYFGVSFVMAGCLYAAGGPAGDSDASESVERYDIANETWTPVANMLEGRRCFNAVCIESEGPAGEQDLFDSLITKALTQRT
jgi:hypothetical protein